MKRLKIEVEDKDAEIMFGIYYEAEHIVQSSENPLGVQRKKSRLVFGGPHIFEDRMLECTELFVGYTLDKESCKRRSNKVRIVKRGVDCSAFMLGLRQLVAEGFSIRVVTEFRRLMG